MDKEEYIRPPDKAKRMRLIFDSDEDSDNDDNQNIIYPENINPLNPINNTNIDYDESFELAIKESLELYDSNDILERIMKEKNEKFSILKPRLSKMMIFDKDNSEIYKSILNYIDLYERNIDIDIVFVSKDEFDNIFNLLGQMRISIIIIEQLRELIRPLE